MASSHQNAAAMSNDAEHHAHHAAAAAPYPIGAAALPEPVNFGVGPPTEEVWEAPLFARIETITATEEEAATVSTENILAWSKPQFKGLTVYFAPDYKPSDENSWARLKADLQAAAAQQGFSLVSKGSKGKSPSDRQRQIFVCARGRCVPNSRKAGSSTRPTNATELCRFRLTVHQDLQLDRFYVKGGQNNPMHRFHSKLPETNVLPKKKRARTSKTTSSSTTVSSAQASAAAVAAAGAPPQNVVWHASSLTRTQRWKSHRGAVLWFTGLSGSGKSSIANEVEVLLFNRNVKTYLLDGDNLRHGLCSDLQFSEADRLENLRRTAEVAKLMADAGMVVLAAFVSPYESHRAQVKGIITSDAAIPFIEIYVKASLATCEKRDPKGLYVKARAGEIANFTGISDPYEVPTNPDIILDSDTAPVKVLAEQVIEHLDYRIEAGNQAGSAGV